MLRNTPTPILITAAYFMVCFVLLFIEPARSYAAIMLYIFPVIVFWAVWSIFTYGKSIAAKLKDDEFGYGG